MTKNSTLLIITDCSGSVSEIIDIDEYFDPFGKCSNELKTAFKGVEFSPPEKLISHILMNA
jgi:hypothetical protein